MTSQVKSGKTLIVPLVIVGVLFFVMGFGVGISGFLTPFLQNAFNLSVSQSYLVTAAIFSAFVVFGAWCGLVGAGGILLVPGMRQIDGGPGRSVIAQCGGFGEGIVLNEFPVELVEHRDGAHFGGADDGRGRRVIPAASDQSQTQSRADGNRDRGFPGIEYGLHNFLFSTYL